MLSWTWNRTFLVGEKYGAFASVERDISRCKPRNLVMPMHGPSIYGHHNKALIILATPSLNQILLVKWPAALWY